MAACSVNIEEVTKLADEAFQSKDYESFNIHYDKLRKANNEEAEAYLNKIKENSLFLIKSYDSTGKISNGIKELEQIENEVPSLSQYAKEKSDELKNKYEAMQTLWSVTYYILNNHAGELENIISPVNNHVLLMKTYEDVEKTITALEKLSSDLNSYIIEVEKIDEKDDSINGLYKAMNDHRNKLDLKINFLKENSASITTANKLKNEDNLFALLTSREITSDFEAINSQIETSLRNLKQRAESIKSY